MECQDAGEKENGDVECSRLISSTPDSQKSTQTTSELVDLTIIYNKIKFEIKFCLDENVGQLKKHLQNVINVPHSLQKVMIKGLAKDERSLRELGVVKGAKIMVVGSKLEDVIAVSVPDPQEAADDKASAVATKEPFCKQKIHRKVLDKGVPEDAMPGIINTKEALPPFPLSGMLNKAGGKVRLTFKLELDQLWIGTKERTDKIPMNSIKSIVSEPIQDFEEYHIMGLQLGTTEASRYWVYWVPAQYVESIKEAVLGTWAL
ncbi:hypothetical protein LSTR_LSTR012563 [Laodelphax striatellus]|uniref:Ubiquitin-like domain-containing protein n=2 Tax=Laodelphax striatellus TaxID=195883 RepID=A0A482XBT4_LAOST|nr:hypothetical protein LSTR_LSTR012563 [Laodelphax striatellus]